jgi:hypothetical protein
MNLCLFQAMEKGNFLPEPVEFVLPKEKEVKRGIYANFVWFLFIEKNVLRSTIL